MSDQQQPAVGIYDDELTMLEAARVMGKKTKSAMSYLSRSGVSVGYDAHGNERRIVLRAGMRGGRWYTRRKWIAEFESEVNAAAVDRAARRRQKASPRKPQLQSHDEATARFSKKTNKK